MEDEEDFSNIKDEKELKEQDINENESDNSLDIQENDNEEYFPESMNLDIANKIDKNDNKLNFNKNNFDQNEDEYIALIEGLENELLIEQYITKSLKKDPSFNEEVNKLKNELNSKNSKLEQLKSINKKQENTLIEFKNKLKKENNKKGMNNKVIINKDNNLNINNLKSFKEVSKNEAINNAIKLKDSALINVINKMNSLKKENEELKKKIYQNESNYNCSHNNNSTYEDSSQKNLEKIKFLQNEIKTLNKQLIEHNKCIEDQNKVNKDYNNLKNELKLLKINNQEIKNKIKEFEKKILNIEINDINNNSIINYNINNLTLKKNNNNLILNLTNKRQSSIRNNSLSRTVVKPQKQNLLPIISIQPLVPNTYNYLYNQNNNKSILTDDFLKNIKKYFNNEQDYYALINKINNIESRGNNSCGGENSTCRDFKIYNTQFYKLDKNQYINFNLEGKENDNNIKMMNYKLNTLKDENKLQNKKIEDLEKHLNDIKNIGKEKDNEISKLLKQINILKNELKLYDK